jgi:hypothetical protein
VGSFNGTCFVSQLPILSGEPCRLVFIRNWGYRTFRKSVGGGFCSPEDLWTPASYPIRGLYSGYGDIVGYDEGSWQFELFRSWVASRAALTASPTVSSIVSRIHDEALFILDGFGRSLNQMSKNPEANYIGDELGYVLVREDVYSPLVEFEKKASVAWSQRIRETLRAFRGADLKSMSVFNVALMSVSDQHLWRIFVEDLERQICEAGSEERAQEILGVAGSRVPEICDFMGFCEALDSLRKPWAPQCGLGSQDDGTDIQDEFLQILHRAATHIVQYGDE